MIAVISDHSPLCMSVQMEKLQQSSLTWRLRVKWLKNPEFVKHVQDETDAYIQLSTNHTNARVRPILGGKLLAL